MGYTFTYGSKDENVCMSVPERPLDEMCEYLERFLRASGYHFEDGERLGIVKAEKNDECYPSFTGDTLTFNDDSIPFCYDFGDNNRFVLGGGVRGGMADDIIKLD